jgi:cysteinyl-tRNA synthetase
MKLHNTLTNTTSDFIPQDPSRVTLYTCGPTVYSEPLIGNWVAYIRWDILVRTLILLGYTPERVMNITDVGHLTSDADEGEDKMQKGARREGITEWEVAARYTESFLVGLAKLGLLTPEHITKATDHIDIQINLVRTLEDKGYTYVLDDGVYFDTAKFPSYADFAHLDLEAQKAGARVEFNTDKRNPSDFVLWRLTPQGKTRAMEWESPWGKGIPGWHIECSAMAMEYLGETIDIHTGGIDHIPVHHTNEIAQSEAATGKLFARTWLHANFLLSEGTKISKSLGNGYTISDIESRGYSPMDFKLFVLQSHYRSESNFTFSNLEGARNRLRHWYAVAELRWQIHDTIENDDNKDLSAVSGKVLAAKQAALEALADDLNTPEALRIIDEAFAEIESNDLQQLQQASLIALIEWIDEALGLELMKSTPDIDDDAKALLMSRMRARETKDWATSDSLRQELREVGIDVRDERASQVWTKVR